VPRRSPARHRGRTHGDDAATGLLASFTTRAVSRQARIVPRAFVSGQRFGFHRRKRAGSDMQCDKTDFHAASANFIQQWLREMQASGWRRDRTVRCGRTRLITLLSSAISPGWRAGYRAATGLRPASPIRGEFRRAGKLQPPVAFVVHFQTVAEIRRLGGCPEKRFAFDAGAFAGAQHHHQSLAAFFFNRRTQIAASPGVRTAQPGGITRDWLRTSTSPGAKSQANPGIDRGSTFPLVRCKTGAAIHHVVLRMCAISPGGSSKLKSAVRTLQASGFSSVSSRNA